MLGGTSESSSLHCWSSSDRRQKSVLENVKHETKLHKYLLRIRSASMSGLQEIEIPNFLQKLQAK